MSRGKVLLVEDEELLRSSLAMYLRKTGYEVSEAEDEAETLKLLDKENYNLVITDLFLSEGSGFEVMRHIQDSCPETKCIVITGHASLDSAIRSLRKGVFDYIMKPFEYNELGAALDRAMSIQSDEKIIKKLDYNEVAARYGLTRKEIEITKIVVSDGLSNADISEQLNISKNTVKVHLRNIFRKVGVESKAGLLTTIISNSK